MSSELVQKLFFISLDSLERFNPSIIHTSHLSKFDYPLEIPKNPSKSYLNCFSWYLESQTRLFAEYLWYEIQLVVKEPLISNPLYPIGNFLAYTDDGYIIPMKSCGSMYQYIRSINHYSLLGMWLKDKLIKAHALEYMGLINKETFKKYGTDTILFYKIEENKYHIKF